MLGCIKRASQRRQTLYFSFAYSAFAAMRMGPVRAGHKQGRKNVGRSIETNGRPVGTRTPDLYRINSLTGIKCDEDK